MTRSPITSRITSILGTYFLSTSADQTNGRSWYRSAHDEALRLSGLLPFCVVKTAGVIAALSPNNQWARNLKDASELMWQFSSQGPVEASRVKVCTFDTNKAKALAILKLQNPTPDDVAAILNGRKVTAFYRCILGDEQSVCVDGHAYSIWVGEPIPTSKTPKIGPLLYLQIVEDYRKAARIVSIRDPIAPAQLQAVTWVTHKRLRQLRP